MPTKISTELEVTMLFCNLLMSFSQYLELDVSVDINLGLQFRMLILNTLISPRLLF